MENLVIIFVTIVILFSATLVTFRLGKSIIFSYLATLGTIAAFLSPLVIDIFGMPLSFQEIFYATLFFSTDVISEHWGKEKARKIIWVVLFSFLSVGLLLGVSTILEVSQVDFIQPHLQKLMEVSPRILLAGFILFVVEQNLDITLFHRIRKKTKGKFLWLRNCGSTMISQLFDTLVFYPIAFYGVYENLLSLMLTAFLFKISIVLLDTPFMYLSYKFKR